MVDTDEIHCHYMYKRYPPGAKCWPLKGAALGEPKWGGYSPGRQVANEKFHPQWMRRWDRHD